MSVTGADMCTFFTYVQVVSCLLAHALCPLGPRMATAPKDELELHGSVPMMLLAFLFPALLFHLFEQFLRTRKDPRPLIMSRLIILELAIAMTYYTVLHSYGGGIVHRNMRSEGAPRPVYLARFVGWALGGLQTNIILTNLPLFDDCGLLDALKRLAPNCLASAAYAWAVWLGMVVDSPAVGWWLSMLGPVLYMATVVDQIEIIMEKAGRTQMLAVKVFPVVVKEAIYVAYAVAYMLSFSDTLSSYTVESCFCFFDMTSKSVAAMFVYLFWAALPAQEADAGAKENRPNLLEGTATLEGKPGVLAKGSKDL